jgi:hypothetical protein
MSLNINGPELTNTTKSLASKTWQVIKDTRISLELFLMSMILGTFILEISRTSVSVGWYIVFAILSSGYILNILKEKIWKQKP